ncbi:anthrone oxygenase family protein [Spirilliplanes yamanashiensis]|uniref:DUF1772 domain-containing protein n=1 Tax=Spirilliplanes yamanashiensis TaxID=42233 RepID=A0A8J3Y5J0_9ACTN|nr:anthrone oxygenase family protein [Spirilliplanes yamanashiensis]MDP9819325.1 putative membrane protein [Spirilliplanes yamanashiensis]GIJ01852.1 hypothetical protein Sya03_12040 [Spirilliplanes yamanashiensis]
MSVLSSPPVRAPHRPSPFAGAVLGAAAVVMGLMAGLFFAFDVSVMPGLAAVDDRTFVAAMQAANAAILNPVFGLTFGGAAVLTLVAGVLLLAGGRRRAATWALAALGLYVVVLVLTMGVEVPLNDQLAAAGDARTLADPAAVRARFEPTWVPVNVFRTLGCTAALACLARAIHLNARG